MATTARAFIVSRGARFSCEWCGITLTEGDDAVEVESGVIVCGPCPERRARWEAKQPRTRD